MNEANKSVNDAKICGHIFAKMRNLKFCKNILAQKNSAKTTSVVAATINNATKILEFSAQRSFIISY